MRNARHHLFRAFAFAVCLATTIAALPHTTAANTDTQRQSFFGNYLAGRHAQGQRDHGRASEFFSRALESQPHNTDLLRRTFVLRLSEGKIKEAVQIAERLEKLKTHAPMSDVVSAYSLILENKNTQAAKKLDAIELGGINGFVVPILKLWNNVAQKKYSQAIKAVEVFKSQDGAANLYNMHVAMVYDLMGEHDKALAHYKKATGKDEAIPLRLTVITGNLLERAGKPDEAQALYELYSKNAQDSTLMAPQIAQLQSRSRPTREIPSFREGIAESMFSLAGSLRRQSAEETALVFGRMALYARPDFSTALLLVGDILENDGKLEEANEMYAAISVTSPLAYAAKIQMAVNLDTLGKTDDGIRTLTQLAATFSDRVQPLTELGDMLRRHKRFDAAVSAYDRAEKRIDNVTAEHWTLFYARGIALEQSKNWPRAEKDFLKALTLKPDQPYVLNYLGYSWIDQNKNLTRALDMIKKATDLRPRDGYIVDSLGWGYYRIGKFGEAVRHLERAVLLRADDPVITDHLGDAYWHVGRKREAGYQWQRVLVLNPDADLQKSVNKKIEHGL